MTKPAIPSDEQQRTERAQRQGEAQMRAVLDAALDAVITMDSGGRVTYWNQRAEVVFGWSRAEAIGRQLADLIMPARYREDHKRGLRHFLSTGAGPILGRRVEVTGLRRDGREFLAELSVSALKEGDDYSFNAFVADISERKQSEQALRESEERYRALYERERAASEQAERLRMATHALGSTLDLQRVLALILSELQRVVPCDSASVQELKGDRLEIIGGYGFTNPTEILGIAFDVASADNPNRDVIRTRAPVVVNDAPTLYPAFARGVHAKTSIRSWLGVPLLFGDRLIGMLALDKNEPGCFTPEHARLAESFATQAAIAMENARLYASAQQEIEERKRIEAQLLQSQAQLLQSQKMEAVGRLAGGIAHDFNNILSVIMGYGELLRRRVGPEDPLHRNVREVLKAADRAAALTRQLLAFSRKQVLQARVLDLRVVVEDVEKMLQRVIGEDVHLATVLPEALGRVRADPGQVEQVLMNLAVNARDAMPDGGRLVIELGDVELDSDDVRAHAGLRPGRYVMLAVTDTGAGMDPETQRRSFEPFFTTKELGKGTGLGLATVYGIVKQSGGYIWVQSEPGHGATFRVYLPRVDEPVDRSAATTADSSLPRGSETILLVEDEDGLRELAQEILEEQGYLVLPARSGAAALSLADGHAGSIHLVVTDMVMPGIGGAELARQLTARRPATKTIYMSGYSEEAILNQGVLNPGTVFLQKPFTPDSLVQKVREVLGSGRTPD